MHSSIPNASSDAATSGRPGSTPADSGTSPRETVTRLVLSLGFAAKEHITLAQKLVADPPREDFDRSVVLPPGRNRDHHLVVLRKCIRQLRSLDMEADALLNELGQPGSQAETTARRRRLADIDAGIQRLLPRFCFSWHVLMGIALLGWHLRERMQTCREQIAAGAIPADGKGGPDKNPLLRLRLLEELVRQPAPEFDARMVHIRELVAQLDAQRLG